MRSRLLALLVGSAATAFLVGCAQVPNQSIHEAKKALEEAQKAGAETYASYKYKAAEVSFDLAMKELSQENRKFPFMRKYNKIIETLKSATSAAQSAQAAVEGAKTQIRAETAVMISHTKALADTVAALLKDAAKKKKNTGSMAAELDSVKAVLKSANEALSADNLLVAREKAADAQVKATALAKGLEKPAPVKKTKTAAKKK